MENSSILKNIVNKLLDSYESSNAIIGGKTKKKKVSLIPIYAKHNASFAVEFNRELEFLMDEGIIMHGRKEQGMYAEAVLNMDNVDKAYVYTGRERKTDINRQLMDVIEKHMHDGCISETACLYLKDKLLNNKKDERYFESEEKLDKILCGLKAVCENSDIVYRRKFSQKVYADTKVFDSLYASPIADLLAFAYEEKIEKYDTRQQMRDAIMEMHNIYKNPCSILIKGDAVITAKDNKTYICLNRFPDGIQLFGDGIKSLEKVELRSEKVITIENLSSFHQFNNPEYFVMYLGGFPNKVQCSFIREYLKNQCSCHNFYHFGDIDKGGMWIWQTLCTRTGINFNPYRMGVDELSKYAQYTKQLTDNDRKNLIMFKAASCQFDNVIDYMIKYNVKLEQEIIDA